MLGQGPDEREQLLERVARYREEYRARRKAELTAERERRHALGEAYVAGMWLPRAQAERVHRRLRRRQVWIDMEIFVSTVLLVATAWGLWKLFAFLLLP